jgi:hypothetical protein
MKILLVEPDYPNKYPPLGLLKIGAYHKIRGDEVTLIKGLLRDSFAFFDRIYITTLFSFYHDRTIKTILHYKKLVGENIRKIFIGGIYATINPKIIFNETGIYPFTGLLDRPGILGNDDIIIDRLPPDYDLMSGANYNWSLQDAYFGYTTRGCPNHCPFCAVPRLEPVFQNYIDIKPYVNSIKEKFGEKTDLVLMDNNVLASNSFQLIIDDLKELGFEKGAKLNKRKRTVDFNQGIDARNVNERTANLLSEICAEPLRLAYDHIKEKKTFERAVRTFNRVGLKDLSTYILYNYLDSPSDLYHRLRHAVDLNAELGTSIYSFPMRYTPLDTRNRRYVGPKWTPKHIRGLQCILNVTKGLVSHKHDLFLEAFGNSEEEFEKIVFMPDKYILERFKHKNNGAHEWRKDFNALSGIIREKFVHVISFNNLQIIKDEHAKSKSIRIKRLLEHYIETDGERG